MSRSEAYRRTSEKSDARHPWYSAPSAQMFCRHKDGETSLASSPLSLGNEGSAVVTLIQVHPLTPHSSPPFLFPVIHS